MEEKRVSINEVLLKELIRIVGTHQYNDVGDLINEVRADVKIITEKVKSNDGK